MYYSLLPHDDPGATEMTGSELLNDGLPVVIKEKPGAAIITYQKKS